MNSKYLTLTILLAVFAFQSIEAQKKKRTTVVVTPAKLEDLPRRAVDTVATTDPETKIILFSNNTWQYYRPTLSGIMDDLPIYRQHWDTSQVFAYRSVELSDIPPIVDIKLISALSDYHYPILGKVFSKYGPRKKRNHNGVDIPLKTGEPIYATFDGKVRYAKYNTGGFGNLVILRHQNGLETWYAHLTRCNVKPNDYVKAGQIIGFGGNTGRSRGPHLHYEIRYKDQTFDPEHLIDFEFGNLKYQTFALEKSYFNIHSRASDQLEEDDDEGLDLLAVAGENVDSEDILDRITKAQTKPEEAKAKTATVTQGNAVYHTVKQGDMLGKIAVKYGVSIDQICRLNNINRTTILKLGRKLRVK